MQTGDEDVCHSSCGACGSRSSGEDEFELISAGNRIRVFTENAGRSSSRSISQYCCSRSNAQSEELSLFPIRGIRLPVRFVRLDVFELSYIELKDQISSTRLVTSV